MFVWNSLSEIYTRISVVSLQFIFTLKSLIAFFHRESITLVLSFLYRDFKRNFIKDFTKEFFHRESLTLSVEHVIYPYLSVEHVLRPACSLLLYYIILYYTDFCLISLNYGLWNPLLSGELCPLFSCRKRCLKINWKTQFKFNCRVNSKKKDQKNKKSAR